MLAYVTGLGTGDTAERFGAETGSYEYEYGYGYGYTAPNGSRPTACPSSPRRPRPPGILVGDLTAVGTSRSIGETTREARA